MTRLTAPDGRLRCTGCATWKPPDEFQVRRDNGRHLSQCKVCEAVRCRKNYESRPPKPPFAPPVKVVGEPGPRAAREAELRPVSTHARDDTGKLSVPFTRPGTETTGAYPCGCGSEETPTPVVPIAKGAMAWPRISPTAVTPTITPEDLAVLAEAIEFCGGIIETRLVMRLQSSHGWSPRFTVAVIEAALQESAVV